MSGRDTARGRILVVQDDAETALFTVYVLANRGKFDVTHTADPATALRLAAAERWDLVVTGMDMAGMTGLELLDAVRRVAPSLPVAVVSAHPVDDALASRPGYADAYLEKPLRVDQLIATATALIGRGRQAWAPPRPGPYREPYPDTPGRDTLPT